MPNIVSPTNFGWLPNPYKKWWQAVFIFVTVTEYIIVGPNLIWPFFPAFRAFYQCPNIDMTVNVTTYGVINNRHSVDLQYEWPVGLYMIGDNGNLLVMIKSQVSKLIKGKVKQSPFIHCLLPLCVLWWAVNYLPNYDLLERLHTGSRMDPSRILTTTQYKLVDFLRWITKCRLLYH